ncbi:MAG: glycerophosphodiester phosphodiesterase [Promethearchaeota archaeon]|jgi:glycerophosphoryl diester phosphodiesterase
MILNFLFVGHRGTRSHFDENTLEAFEIALNHGANYIEFDIRELRDGNLIVIHDSSLDRTTNGSGLVKDYDYSEISNLNTKNKNCKIPLLHEVLEKFRSKIYFIIELKEVDSWQEVIDIVIKKKVLLNTIFSGRNLVMLELIKTKVPGAQVCYNITKGQGCTLKNFLDNRGMDKLTFIPDIISLRSNLIEKEFIEKCHKHKILALAWDFINYKNPIEKIKYLIDLGIDGILFDDYRNIGFIKDYLLTS